MYSLVPGSSAPEHDIEVVHAERAWYFFSHEDPQGGRETLIEHGRTRDSEQEKERK